MYDPIVLTLDGSKLAESAVLHAAEVAKRFSNRVIVLRVVTPIVGPDDFAYGPNPYTYQHLLEAELKAAETYVAVKARELEAQGLRVEGLVRQGEPASTILDVLAERKAGLLVIATHGRTGVARWVFGSVADRVLRGSPTPILLVRPIVD